MRAISRNSFISRLPSLFFCGIDEHIMDIKDINVKNTLDVKSEAPTDTAFLSKYRKLPILLSSPFVCERLRTECLFFPSLQIDAGCTLLRWLGSSGTFLFARIKRARHAKRNRIDAFLINSGNDREKKVTEKTQINIKRAISYPQSCTFEVNSGSDVDNHYATSAICFPGQSIVSTDTAKYTYTE